MNRKALIAGALTLALAGGVSSMEKTKEAGTCPMRVPGAKVSVVNIESGAVIHVTGADAATVAKIQAAAAGAATGAVAHSGCKHCAASAGCMSSEKSSCGHGDSCGGAQAAVYACSMGCYSGAKTKDGRCPKCGMELSIKK